MLRRSLVLLSKPRRTIVRDPRKRRIPSIPHHAPAEIDQTQERRPLSFEPSSENQSAVGSSLGSFALAGAGMALGFSIVGAVFGGF